MVSSKPLSSPSVISFSRQKFFSCFLMQKLLYLITIFRMFSSPAVILLSGILISYWSITYLLPLGAFWSYGQYRKKLQPPLLEELWPKSKRVARWKAQNLFFQMYHLYHSPILWNFVLKKHDQWFSFAFRNKNIPSGSCFVFHICSFKFVVSSAIGVFTVLISPNI